MESKSQQAKASKTPHKGKASTLAPEDLDNTMRLMAQSGQIDHYKKDTLAPVKNAMPYLLIGLAAGFAAGMVALIILRDYVL